jgi:hypothetical protein
LLARAGFFLTALYFTRSHSRAGIGLGTTAKYPQCTTTQRHEHLATHNKRRRGQRPKLMPGTTHVPLRHARPEFAFSMRASFTNK